MSLQRPVVLLGPCRCRGCGEPLWWSRAGKRIAWFEIDGTPHLCPDHDRLEAARKLLRRLASGLRESAA